MQQLDQVCRDVYSLAGEGHNWQCDGFHFKIHVAKYKAVIKADYKYCYDYLQISLDDEIKRKNGLK